jgi:DNA-binding transcriptional MerR regulator
MRSGDLARLLGEERHVVHYWEKAFGIRSRRSIGNQRYYMPGDVARFKEIRRLLRVELYTIEGAKRQLRLAAAASELAKETG